MRNILGRTLCCLLYHVILVSSIHEGPQGCQVRKRPCLCIIIAFASYSVTWQRVNEYKNNNKKHNFCDSL